jgi:glycosyltransferase involved in cell wall biosynthesis
MTSLVSVVLATYNSERFLAEAVRSILAQTYTNLELIVVDDGSTDGTRDLVDGFLADGRVKYVYQKNAGQPSADNAGIAQARGSFIAFNDADDVWMPDKLERQMPLFDHSRRVGVVYSPLLYIDEAGEPVSMWPMSRYGGRVTDQLFVTNFVSFSSAIVRRECFDTVGLFDEHLAQAYDYDLWLRISTEFEFALLDEPTVYYRVWPGQMSRNFRQRYDCAIRIMSRFQATYPGALTERAIREGWAHTFASRAHLKQKYERATWHAIADYARALRVNPAYVPAIKGIVRALLY